MYLSEEDLRHSAVTREIIGAAFEVHRVLGMGFLESVYEQALAHELKLRQIVVERQVEVPIYYKNVLVGSHVLDLLVDNEVIVELKAIKELADAHSAVVLSYLAATKRGVALLLNFGKPSLQHKRLVTPYHNPVVKTRAGRVADFVLPPFFCSAHNCRLLAGG